MKRIRFLLVAALVLLCLGRSSECEAAAYAYVANNQDPYIGAIKIADLTIVDLIDLGADLEGNLLGVAITPDGEVYVANPGADAVYVIDANGDVSTINNIGVKPTGVAASRIGDYVYVTNRGDGKDNGTVSKINTSTGEIVPINVGIDPIGVAVSPEGDLIWVANRKSGSLSIIDANDDVDTIYNIGEKPVGVAVSPRGDYVYVTNRGEGTVSVIDTVSRQEVTVSSQRPKVGTAPIGVAVSPDGSLVYVASLYIDEGAIFVIDTSEAPDHFEVIDRIKPVGERPVGLAPTPDGDYLVVTNRGDSSTNGTVSVIRVSDRRLIDPIEDVGEKPASFGQFIASISVPEAPSDLTATTESDSQIDLSWSDNSFDELGFKIERKGQSENIFIEIDDVDANVTSYSNGDLLPDTTYSYRVRAYNNHGNSDSSDEAEATTGIILDPPTNLTATGVSHSRIRLSWEDNSFGESGVEIWRLKEVSEETDSGTDTETSDDATDENSGETTSETISGGTYSKIAEVGADVTGYSDDDLEPYTTYRYRVRAYDDAGGLSGYSNEVEKRTKDDCFIATAAYGSLMEPRVVTLRHFRDAYLIPHALGRVFVRTYYATSPPIANYISRHETLRAVVRASLLPLVAFSYSMLHLGLTLTFTILVFVALSPVGLHWLCQSKKRGHKAAV